MGLPWVRLQDDSVLNQREGVSTRGLTVFDNLILEMVPIILLYFANHQVQPPCKDVHVRRQEWLEAM